MITPSQIDRYVHVIEEADVVNRIVKATRRDNRGRPTNTDLIHLFILGLMLAVDHRGKATIRAIKRTLTEDLTIDDQLRLGVRVGGKLIVTENALQNVARLFHQKLEFGPRTAPDLEPGEQDDRRDAVQDILDAVCDVFVTEFTPMTVAIDATNLWTWSRSKTRKPSKGPIPEWENDYQGTPAEGSLGDDVDSGEPESPDKDGVTEKDANSDAGWGGKTAKNGGTEYFYGYHEHTVVLAAHGLDDPQVPPPLIVRYTLASPSAHLAETTLGLLDRTPDRPGEPGKTQITDVLVDRHYSYKRSEDWHDKLAERGISQTLDLHENDQGWSDLDGVRFAAGVPHCPVAPEHLGVIPGLGLNPSPQAVAAFKAKIEEREQYALRKNSTIDPVTGKAQWQCPARAGKVACPLVAGTVQAAGQLMTSTGQSIPIIDAPPDPNDPICPKVCTQATVVIDPGELRKVMQSEYWGTSKWRAKYNKRSVVEGSYGNRKNIDAENLRRGHHRAGGIGRSMLYSIGAVASYNMRMLRNWHERTGQGDPDNPLLRPDDIVYGYAALSEAELAERLRAAS